MEVRDRFEDLGRRGAQVACRSLGYTTGAQILVGAASPFPSPDTVPRVVTVPRVHTDVICSGFESSLTDCDIETDDDESLSLQRYRSSYAEDIRVDAVALICTTPTGAVPQRSCV